MNVVRMNQRNCGGTEALAATLYHSGRSQDVAAVARDLIDQDHISRLSLVGFSMGGNLVLKLAGEWGSAGPAQFRAVAAVCPAVDLAASADALHLRSNRLYEEYFLWKLKGRLRTKARLFPETFDTSRLRGIASLRDFDDKITAYYCGFAGAADYYDRAAAAHVVDRIAVPTFILHAANDPFIRILPETRRKILDNPNITFLETEDGGHCSYLADSNGDDGHWAEIQVVEFLRNISCRRERSRLCGRAKLDVVSYTITANAVVCETHLPPRHRLCWRSRCCSRRADRTTASHGLRQRLRPRSGPSHDHATG